VVAVRIRKEKYMLPKTLVWIDCETSGLDPHKDKVLELYAFATSFNDPFNVEDGVRGVEKVFPFKDWSAVPPEVIAMHSAYDVVEETSLMRECMLAVPSSSRSYNDYQEMDALLCRTFAPGKTTDPEYPPVLAGSTVHFDLNFVRTHFPQFASRLSHRVYDVSAIKLFCCSLGMPEIPKTTPQHRARGDIMSSIEHAKKCIEWLEKRHASSCAVDCGELVVSPLFVR
jgi:oligoribonuclease